MAGRPAPPAMVEGTPWAPGPPMRAYVINLTRRADRWAHFETMMAADSPRRPRAITAYERVEAIDAAKTTAPAVSPTRACHQSHLVALRRALADLPTPETPVAVCEDDCVFTPHFDAMWAYFTSVVVAEAPQGSWDVLCGGISGVSDRSLWLRHMAYKTRWRDMDPRSHSGLPDFLVAQLVTEAGWANGYSSPREAREAAIVDTRAVIEWNPPRGSPCDVSAYASGSHCLVYNGAAGLRAAIRCLTCALEVDLADNTIASRTETSLDILLSCNTVGWFTRGVYVVGPFMAYTLPGDHSDIRSDCDDKDDSDDPRNDMETAVLPTEKRVCTALWGARRAAELFRLYHARGLAGVDAVEWDDDDDDADQAAERCTDLALAECMLACSEQARKEFKKRFPDSFPLAAHKSRGCRGRNSGCQSCAVMECPYSCEKHYVEHSIAHEGVKRAGRLHGPITTVYDGSCPVCTRATKVPAHVAVALGALYDATVAAAAAASAASSPASTAS